MGNDVHEVAAEAVPYRGYDMMELKHAACILCT
jgi:hypothetical protein